MIGDGLDWQSRESESTIKNLEMGAEIYERRNEIPKICVELSFGKEVMGD